MCIVDTSSYKVLWEGGGGSGVGGEGKLVRCIGLQSVAGVELCI